MYSFLELFWFLDMFLIILALWIKYNSMLGIDSKLLHTLIKIIHVIPTRKGKTSLFYQKKKKKKKNILLNFFSKIKVK